MVNFEIAASKVKAENLSEPMRKAFGDEIDYAITDAMTLLERLAADEDPKTVWKDVAGSVNGAVPGVSDRAHRTRKNELVEGGWVVDSGRTRRTATESEAVVWVLTERGRREWS